VISQRGSPLGAKRAERGKQAPPGGARGDSPQTNRLEEGLTCKARLGCPKWPPPDAMRMSQGVQVLPTTLALGCRSSANDMCRQIFTVVQLNVTHFPGQHPVQCTRFDAAPLPPAGCPSTQECSQLSHPAHQDSSHTASPDKAPHHGLNGARYPIFLVTQLLCRLHH